MAPRSDHKFSRIPRALILSAAVLLVIGLAPGTASADDPDPRIGLGAGWLNAQTAISNLEHLAHEDKPPGFVDPANPGSFAFVTSDLAFGGNHAFMGNFNGFNIFDISNPTDPTVVTSVICPGGQGDMSVHGNLLFMSVEESRARVDCGTNPAVGVRFQGVRIFDISDVQNPVQVAAVQLCRGSHTHSLVADPDDPNNVYVYVSGTAGVRPASTLAGCNNNPADRREPVAVADRGHPGPASDAKPGGGRQRTDDCSPIRRPVRSTACRTRCRRRCTHRGCRWVAAAHHRRLPRHHHLPVDRAGRRRLRGQRPPDRHLRSRQPGTDRRGV